MTNPDNEPEPVKRLRVYDDTLIGTTDDGRAVYARNLSPDYRRALEAGLKKLDDGVL